MQNDHTLFVNRFKKCTTLHKDTVKHTKNKKEFAMQLYQLEN